MSASSKLGVVVKSIQYCFVAGSLLWIGSNILSSCGNPCDRAKAKLEQATTEEQERREEAKVDGYRFTDGALQPLMAATQRRMYAQEDANLACEN